MFVFLAVGRSCGCNAIVTVDSTIDPGFLKKTKEFGVPRKSLESIVPRSPAQVPKQDSQE